MLPESTIDDAFYRTAVSTIIDTYTQLGHKPQNSAWTVLASFFLSRKPNLPAGTSGEIKVISLATGTKCIPASRLSKRGEMVHDSHAEVLARRCAFRWFLEEILRVQSSQSDWIKQSKYRKYTFREGVELNLYISTVPCGDASMRFLASSQDEEMASLKNSSAISVSDLDPNAPSRGRDNYARLGALRTKPGRADSPPTLCMSCSDKIARWNVLGIQGALGAKVLEPIYLSNIVIGEVNEDLRETVREDCERAFWARLGDITGLPEGYSIHKPKIHFTEVPFAHSRSVSGSSNSCAQSFYWISESQPHQVLINGLKRGVAPKHRYREKSRPLVCRLSLLQLRSIVPVAPLNSHLNGRYDTYIQMKKASSRFYQGAKDCLVGKQGPFSGWVHTGLEFQNFDLRPEERVSDAPELD